jgi:hypothetical protein
VVLLAVANLRKSNCTNNSKSRVVSVK